MSGLRLSADACSSCPGSCAVIPATHDIHYSAGQLLCAERLQRMTGFQMNFDPERTAMIPQCSEDALGASEFDEAVSRLNLVRVIRGAEGCTCGNGTAVNA